MSYCRNARLEILTTTKDLHTLPETFTDEWASEIARAALMYLSRHYVAGADLSVLGPREARATAAATASDARAYREAMRGYVRAGLRAFGEAGEGSAA
jgi:hypothetical protein